jgi:hypothetical protein
LRQFFESRIEYLAGRECHSEWHAARMREALARHFLDVERLLWREQVSGLGRFEGPVGGKVAAGVSALARLPSKARTCSGAGKAPWYL